jgi:hypothetical protein
MAVSSMTMFLIGCAAFQVRDIKSQACAEASFSGVFNPFSTSLIFQKIRINGFFKNHKLFGKQAKTATTNGVFWAKNS